MKQSNFTFFLFEFSEIENENLQFLSSRLPQPITVQFNPARSFMLLGGKQTGNKWS